MTTFPMANETKAVNLMPTPDKFALTGISGLDSILEGGIPRSNVTLVEGAIGTGKTTMGVEFVYRGASEFNEPGIIVLFEVSPEKVVRDAAQLGWDLTALERQGRVKIVFTTRQVFRQELQQADSLLLQTAAQMGAARLFVDGVAGVIDGGGDGQEPREAFHVLVEGLQRDRLTAMLAVEATALTQDRQPGVEESIADTVIRLRMEEMQRATTRSIEIIKARVSVSRVSCLRSTNRFPRCSGTPRVSGSTFRRTLPAGWYSSTTTRLRRLRWITTSTPSSRS